jgi:hypothetical protein
VASASGAVWAATDAGLSRIAWQRITLAQKVHIAFRGQRAQLTPQCAGGFLPVHCAAFRPSGFRRIMQPRGVWRRGELQFGPRRVRRAVDRRLLGCSKLSVRLFTRPRSVLRSAQLTFFRGRSVAVEGSAESVAAAWRAFEAMEFLYNVTGVQGLMARTYGACSARRLAFAPAHALRPQRLRTSRLTGRTGTRAQRTLRGNGWATRPATMCAAISSHSHSSMTSLPTAAPTALEVCVARMQPCAPALSDAPLFAAAALVTDSVAYIVKNDFFLVDVTGRPTTWGVWNPQVLNLNSSYSDERGLNSLQMLSFLLAAYRLSGDDSFTAAYQVRGPWRSQKEPSVPNPAPRAESSPAVWLRSQHCQPEDYHSVRHQLQRR